MMQRLLLIEDTATLQLIYSADLMNAGYTVDIASSGAEGLKLFNTNSHSVVVMDLFLPDMDGIEVIQKLVHDNPQAKIIVITSNGSVNRAVEAMRAGAFDFLLKPFSDERLLATVSSALTRFEHNPEIDMAEGNFYGFTGRGPLMQEMYRKITRVAASTAPVFVIGEKGSGKEVCAKAIHDLSGLKSNPFIVYSSSQLTFSAQQNTLLGMLEDGGLHPETAEPGALQKAYSGTLYISEISKLDPLMQSKLAILLRNAKQNDYNDPQFPRIICSTSIDPYQLLETRKIREDLFYLLHVLTVDVPALSDLGSDIVFIAEALLARFSRGEQKNFSGLTKEVGKLFMSHNWPGNISQLANLLHKIVASYDASKVALDMLPTGFSLADKEIGAASLGTQVSRLGGERRNHAIQQLVGLQLEEVERQFIDATIFSQGGSIPKAAEVLGLAPSTIYRKRSKR
ncbi:MAG: sigma-54 dependent transcriptional regulator [Rhodobacterales bacterium]